MFSNLPVEPDDDEDSMMFVSPTEPLYNIMIGPMEEVKEVALDE